MSLLELTALSYFIIFVWRSPIGDTINLGAKKILSKNLLKFYRHIYSCAFCASYWITLFVFILSEFLPKFKEIDPISFIIVPVACHFVDLLNKLLNKTIYN